MISSRSSHCKYFISPKGIEGSSKRNYLTDIHPISQLDHLTGHREFSHYFSPLLAPSQIQSLYESGYFIYQSFCLPDRVVLFCFSKHIPLPNQKNLALICFTCQKMQQYVVKSAHIRDSFNKSFLLPSLCIPPNSSVIHLYTYPFHFKLPGHFF